MGDKANLHQYDMVPRITRNRTVNVCIACYKRRVKCDRKKPRCSKCVASNIGCEYATDGDIDTLGTLTDLRQKKGTTKRMRAREHDPNECDIGYLEVNKEAGTSRYVSSAYWGCFFKKGAGCGGESFFGDEVDAKRRRETDKRGQYEEILQKYLPERSVADELVSEYFSSVHPFVGILDRVINYQKYLSFWTSHTQGQYTDPSFACIIFVMFYGACVSKNELLKYSSTESQLLLTNSYSHHIQHFLTASDSLLRFCEFPDRPSIPCLIATMILQVLLRTASSPTTAANVAIITRISQVMGLHRDPGFFRNANLDSEDVQQRRRIWWQLIFLDGICSVSSGLPPSLNTSLYDVQLPNEKYDLEEDQMVQIYNNTRSLGCRVEATALTDIYGIQRPTKTTITHLHRYLEDYKGTMDRQIAVMKEFAFVQHSQHTTQKVLLNLRDMMCAILELIYFKSLLFLCHPHFSGSDDADDNAIKAGAAALGVLEKFLESTKLPDHAKFIWAMTAGHQFHALIYVMRDIYQDLDDIDKNDRRIEILTHALERTEYLRLNEGSAFTEKQWQLILYLRDFVWQQRLGSAFSSSGYTSISMTASSGTMPMEDVSTDGSSDPASYIEDSFIEIIQDMLDAGSIDADWANYGLGY
ncbi:fungal-specific transcription factor domain-containing protein [Lipomyces orientalis]|uniref:Fungal-specific transcription factor domain-containing protein n=1 Tax=Lipomyces orientalis TaxID=1233043 RepID=A0ACC3TUT5_9ASCO